MRTQWRGGKFSVCRVSFSFSKGEEKWLKIRKGVESRMVDDN